MLSIYTVLILLIYGGFLAVEMIARSNFKVTQREEEDYFTDLDKLQMQDGFNVAAAIVGFGEAETKDVPSHIGALKFYHKYWPGDNVIDWREIRTRECTWDDFNSSQRPNSDAKFFKTQQTAGYLETYAQNMRCVEDQNELYTHGNYNTPNAGNFMIVFEKCDETKTPEIKCANDTVINEWMVFKYIITLENHKKFKSHMFGDQTTLESAEIKWYALTNQTRKDYVNLLTRTKMNHLDDLFFNFNSKIRESFDYDQLPARDMVYRNKIWNAITYEMSMNQKQLDRRVYTSLDLASDLGGLFTTLSSICLLIVTLVNYYGSYQFVMEDTFYDRAKIGSPWLWSTTVKRYDFNDVQWNTIKTFKVNLHTFFWKYLPKCCRCCIKPNRKQRQRSAALNYNLNETNIANIIMELRVLKAAAKETRTAEEWINLRRANLLLAYSDLDSERDDKDK